MEKEAITIIYLRKKEAQNEQNDVKTGKTGKTSI